MKRIMVVVDPMHPVTFEAQPALGKGRRLAQAFGAQLHLYVARYHPSLDAERRHDTPGLIEARQSLMERTERWLTDAVDALDFEGLTVTTSVQWDNPWHEAILREVGQADVDLLLKDIWHHPQWGRIFFTDTDWYLIRRCPVPLYLARRPQHRDARRIIAALDPMHAHDKPAALDRKILRTAITFSDALGAQLHVVHSYMPMTAALSAGLAAPVWVGPMDELNENIETAHRNALAQVLDGHKLAADQVHVEMGSPARVLIDKAEQLDASLIVMGAVSRTALKRLFVGSTAERVFGEVVADLLVIKPDSLLARLRNPGND